MTARDNLFADLVRRKLLNLDMNESIKHSVMDHHVPGLHYLNIERSDKFTLKLYLLDGAKNNQSGFLIHPHSHRYNFNTVVLAGRVKNVIFQEAGLPAFHDDLPMVRMKYSPEKGLEEDAGKPLLLRRDMSSADAGVFGPGQTYFLFANQIHTLEVMPGKTLLCLSQFEDVRDHSRLYLPPRHKLKPVTSRPATMPELQDLREQCLSMLERK